MSGITLSRFPENTHSKYIENMESLWEYCIENSRKFHNLLLITRDNKYSVLKFGFAHNRDVNIDEANNYEKISKYKCTPKLLNKQVTELGSFFVMEFKQPHPLGANVKVAAPKLSSHDLKCITKQVLDILLTLQQAFKGFKHNDLKADNVLLFDEGSPVVKFIDFESSYSSDESIVSGLFSSKNEEEFGLCKHPCPMFDFHLFTSDLCHYTNDAEFHAFFMRIFPDDYPLTSRGRLTSEAQLVTKFKDLHTIKDDLYFLHETTH